MASASISTTISGSMSFEIWIMAVAGRMSLKTSPWARPYSSQRAMSVTKSRVRTTSLSVAPPLASAFSMFLSVWIVCW